MKTSVTSNDEPIAAQLDPLVGPDEDDAEDFRPMCCSQVMNCSTCSRCGKDRMKEWTYFAVMRSVRLNCLRAARLIELRAPELIVRGEIAEIVDKVCRGW